MVHSCWRNLIYSIYLYIYLSIYLSLHRSSVEFQRELKKKKVLLFFIIIGMTTRMSSDALSKVEREHRWSKCFDNSPWRTLRMTLREAVTLQKNKKLHLLYDISLYPTLWLHTLAIWIYWGSAAFEYLIVMNVWFIMTLFSSIYEAHLKRLQNTLGKTSDTGKD